MGIIFQIGFIFILAFSLSLFSDTILLKNGTFVRGKTTLKEDQVVVETFDGKFKNIPKKEILKIDLRNISEKEIKELREQEEKLEIARRDRIKKANEEIQRRIDNIKSQMKRANEEQNQALLQELENLKKQMQEVDEDNSVTHFGPLFRSSVLPGWGNIFVGNAKKKNIVKYFGFGYLGLSLALLLNSGQKYLDQLDRKNNYENKVQEYTFFNALLNSTSIPNQNLVYGFYFLSEKNYSEYKTENINYNQSIQALGFVYLVQLTHAYYLGYSSYREYLTYLDEKKIQFSFNLKQEKSSFDLSKGQSLELKIEYRF